MTRLHHRTLARAVAIPVLLLLGGAAAGAQEVREIKQPWGVAALSSGELIVMETDGGMLRVDPARRKTVVLVPRFRPYLALDVTTSPLGPERDAVFVSLRFRTGGGGEFNRVRQYTPGGELVREGPVSPTGTFAGIAVDAASETLWLVDAPSGEIHAVDYADLSSKGESSSKRLARVRDVGILGPLACDVDGERLFVADSLRGTLLAIPLDSLIPRQVAAELGEPQALAVDAGRRRLYVADAAGRRIWVLDLSAAEPEPTLFARPPELRSPVGITVTPDGTLWVADPEANKLFALGAGGAIVNTIP